ncbi:MAG: MBL fold metallo-hydrolase [Chloroflexi bacterium]|nr:MAG: MBL fold metallo-hydrolase [Chloroflexota bacterium]
MEITYFGLNSIRLRGREATVLIDPYEPKLGLAPVRLNVQVVILTHEDPTHFSMQGLGNDYHLVSGAGEFEIKGVAMHGIQTFHDARHGAERGKNFVYVLDIDDLRDIRWTKASWTPSGARSMSSVSRSGVGVTSAPPRRPRSSIRSSPSW